MVRAAARFHEKSKDWLGAIALWEKVRQLEPNDHEARSKISNLSIEDHLAKGNYRR
jgi:hypothetical protein